MGRAQVKFRATHGRGRGRGRGRGAGAPRGRGGARGGSSGGRSLGSNAFRYEEREQDEEEEGEAVELQPAATGRRQFFADEKSYRPTTGAAKGTYFQSRAVQQWEADEGDDEDGGAAFGVLDFHWFAKQLAAVSPSIRYRMDPKDCVDLAFEPVQDQDTADSLLVGDEQEPAPTSKASALRASVPSKADEAALDSLLELSASASTTAGSRVASGLAASTATASAPAIAAAAMTSQAQMEDWLDDVLDM